MKTTHKISMRSAAIAALRPGRLVKDGLHLTISALGVLAAVLLVNEPGNQFNFEVNRLQMWEINPLRMWWEVPILTGLAAVALLAALAGARLFAVVERVRARGLLNVTVAEPLPMRPPRPGPLSWIRHQFTDITSWRALLYTVLFFLLTAVSIVWVAQLSVAFDMFEGDLTWPFNAIHELNPTIPGAQSGTQGRLIAGSLALLTIPFGIALLAKANRVLVQRLLGPSAAERARMLERGRDHAVDTAVGDLRRIERDLHDGVQARLVALTMELGRVRKQLQSDPQAADGLLEQAHADAKLALSELRDLARGIYPAVLTDRGLDPALSALAAQMPLPVTVDVTLPGRPPAPMEAAGYFVIAELLANVAKHSQAHGVIVTVHGETDRLMIEVIDDGQGGADPTLGTGLTGLTERVAALEGTLTVDSPAGGPTRITVEIPCRQYRYVSS